VDVKIETKEGVNVCSSALFRDSGVLEGDAIRSEECLCISVDVPAVFCVSSTAMYAVYQLSTRQREDVSTGLFGTPVLCCIHRVTVT